MTETDDSSEFEPRTPWNPSGDESMSMDQMRSNPQINNATALCSLCGLPFNRVDCKSFPFCSARCQQLDLGLWLDERLGLPVEGQEEQEFRGYDSD